MSPQFEIFMGVSSQHQPFRKFIIHDGVLPHHPPSCAQLCVLRYDKRIDDIRGVYCIKVFVQYVHALGVDFSSLGHDSRKIIML